MNEYPSVAPIPIGSFVRRDGTIQTVLPMSGGCGWVDSVVSMGDDSTIIILQEYRDCGKPTCLTSRANPDNFPTEEVRLPPQRQAPPE